MCNSEWQWEASNLHVNLGELDPTSEHCLLLFLLQTTAKYISYKVLNYQPGCDATFMRFNEHKQIILKNIYTAHTRT